MQERDLPVESLGDSVADERVKLIEPQNWSLCTSSLPNGLGKYGRILLVKREQHILHAINSGRIEDGLGARLMRQQGSRLW